MDRLRALGSRWRTVGWLIAAAFFVAAIWSLFTRPVDWSDVLGSFDWPLVAISLALLAVAQAVRGLMGWASGPLFDQPLSAADSYRFWHLSQVAKYLPGGVWLVPARSVMYSDRGMPGPAAGAVVVWETAVVLVTGVAVSVVGGAGPAIGSFGLIVAVVLGLGLSGILLWRPIWRWLAGRDVKGAAQVLSALSQKRGRHARFVRPLLVAVFSWLLIGIGFHVLLLASRNDIEANWLEISALYIAAWTVGFLVVIAPAGLGVREFTLAALLVPIVGSQDALIIAVVARLWWVAVEFLHVAIATGLRARLSAAKRA